MRNRAWRRKKTEAIWNRRCKEHMYMALIPSDEKVRFVSKLTGNVYLIPKSWRFPLSWKDFKKNVKWSKYLRDNGKIQSDKGEQMDNHRKNKMERLLSKRIIDDGINEYEDDLTEFSDEDFLSTYDDIFD